GVIMGRKQVLSCPEHANRDAVQKDHGTAMTLEERQRATQTSVMPPALTLRLFGPFEARLHGRPIPRLRTRKGEWLLALLALRHSSEIERSWLAGLLWPESAEPQALANLRLSLTDLRRALGPEAVRLYSPTARTLALDLAGVEVDVARFDACAARG